MTGQWREIARAPRATGARSSDGVLTLHQCGGDFVIRVGARALMSSRDHASEAFLAEVGCRPIADREGARGLLGGLGMGFTLRAALDVLGPSARVVVAEIAPSVVAWNRGPLADLADRPAFDPRVEIRVVDVVEYLRSATQRFDAILLDVDNGPQGLTRRANHALYTQPGLTCALRTLRRGGIFALWSAARHPALVGRMARAGFSTQETAAPGGRVIYLGRAITAI